MTEPLAHSARPKLGIPPQPYAEHVLNVTGRANENAEKAAKHSPDYGAQLIQAVRFAAEFHDLGKLDEANQRVLASRSRDALPINHVDAGVAHIFHPSINNLLAATLVYAHHAGLPDFQDQRNNKAGYVLRDRDAKETTDGKLADYLGLHAAVAQEGPPHEEGNTTGKLAPLLFRIALSCLVDADHGDTARHYGQEVALSRAELRPADRLELLDTHIRFLANSREDERTILRNEVYKACRSADTGRGMYACDSPVGTGKTTAVMAHLLHAAARKELRRIFVVLPFTNIIDQSVEVYRRALVGLGERTEDVVAAHHHRAEFDDIESRQFAFLWEAPIVVTTAVQFFETLASDHPAALRKLHQVPGSAVFIDEAHAALPVHLWPQAWRWLHELESKWGCHFVLGSGSLNRFWEAEEFSEPPVHIPELVSEGTRSRALKYEGSRVEYRSRADVLALDDLIAWGSESEGPRLLIVNTVQSAAVVAREAAVRNGRQSVEHLSTALCPRDRKATLDRVKARLQDEADSSWTLVATSCVEAGVDLSFRTAFRERCSLNSLIQIGGRVNRKGEYPNAEVWDFRLRHEGLLKDHPAFDTSVRVLGDLFGRGHVGPERCTEAMLYEIRSDGMKADSGRILTAERSLDFPTVAEKFNVIDSNTVTALVDQDLVQRIEKREKVARDLVQALSVQIWGYRKDELALKPIEGFPGLYAWTLTYDRFLGYMAGVLPVEALKQQGGCTV